MPIKVKVEDYMKPLPKSDTEILIDKMNAVMEAYENENALLKEQLKEIATKIENVEAKTENNNENLYLLGRMKKERETLDEKIQKNKGYAEHYEKLKKYYEEKVNQQSFDLLPKVEVALRSEKGSK